MQFKWIYTPHSNLIKLKKTVSTDIQFILPYNSIGMIFTTENAYLKRMV